MYIPRIQEGFLDRWWAAPDRKPLVLCGARQVGKSTLVRAFAAKRGLRLAEVNLEEHLTSVRQAFDEGTISAIMAACSRVTGLDLSASQEQTLLFLDEIQTVPAALRSLRYLYEKLPHLGVIAAGSVLEFALTAEPVSIPVGRVTYLFLPPITFKEFLIAAGRTDLRDVVSSADPRRPESVTHDQHAQLLRVLREYLVIGGMPAAVVAYVEKGVERYASPARVHTDLVSSCRDDLQKYPATRHIRDVIREVFDRSPAQIGSKVKYSRLALEQPSRDVRKALRLLLDAGLLHAALHTDAQGVPLGAGEEAGLLKLFSLDVGLLLSQLGFTAPHQLPAEPDRLVNEGVLAKQYVAQELLAASPSEQRPQLHYWLREKKASNAEVDFVISSGPLVIPVEVKAGAVGQMKSLWEFCRTHATSIALRFDANLPAEIQHEVVRSGGGAIVRVLNLPLYMVSEAWRLV